MKKILIIGKKGFLGANLKKNFLKKYNPDNLSYEMTKKKKPEFFDKYSHIINTTIHPKYVKNKYQYKYDFDLNFINKFKEIGFHYIFLNSRKIYRLDENITENSELNPMDNYAKNKLITEEYLKKHIKKKLISLRISNIIGKRIYKNPRNTHKLFFDNFLIYKKKFKNSSKVFYVKDDFKDFLSIKQFSNIIDKIIQLNISGIYNVSLSKKIYISEIIKWIDIDFFKNTKFIRSSKDSFTLSNKKLIKKIKIKISKNQLRQFCKNLI